MEIDTEIPPSDLRSLNPPNNQADDPYVADLLKVADDKIAQLTQSVHVLDEEKQGLNTKCNGLKKQVSS